nr:hypothetical protein [Tanacetum cinerariifolium]
LETSMEDVEGVCGVSAYMEQKGLASVAICKKGVLQIGTRVMVIENKVMQLYDATNNELSIPPLQAPIALPTILRPSLVLPPSPYFFVPKEILPHKKQIHTPSSSVTMLFNSSQKQACILVPPSFSTYAPTPPQIYELGKSSIKISVKHHEEQVESILNYLEELPFHRIEKMEEILVNGWIIIQDILMK